MPTPLPFAELSTLSVEAEVIDPRTLVPLDLATILESVARTNRALVVHEEVERSGWGAELVALIATHGFDDLDAPPLRLGSKNAPIPFGVEMEALIVPQVSDIVRMAGSLVRA